MSQYNEYARKLDEAFRTASREHKTALATYQEAVDAYENETDPQEKTVKAVRRDQAKDELRRAQRSTWTTFRNTRTSLEKQLAEAVARDQLADPDAVDDHTVALINSGILKGADLAHLAERYDDNVTMRRIIGKHAHNLSINERDPEELRTLNNVANACNRQPDILKQWDALRSVSISCSGEQNAHANADTVASLCDNWDRADIQAAIDEF